ncbi:MAG: hypothetical protein LBU81_04710 [Methanosarcinales archaeon]|jgi:hypothetical protein|nr:hypothetical protein [Methanosarcinales archaeon]
MTTERIMDQLRNIRNKQKTSGRQFSGTKSKIKQAPEKQETCFGCNIALPLSEDSIAIDTPLRKRILICRKCDDENYEHVITKMELARFLNLKGTEIKWIYGSDGKIHAYQKKNPKTPICGSQVILKGRNCNPEKLIPVVCKDCAIDICSFVP